MLPILAWAPIHAATIDVSTYGAIPDDGIDDTAARGELQLIGKAPHDQ